MMIRWQCSFVVLILTVNLLQFGSGSLEIVKPNEDSCDLPCVDKIADRIFEHLAERYDALERRIIEKAELQLIQIERIIEERITRIETLFTEQISANVGNVPEYKEISKEIHKAEQNSTQLDFVVDTPKNDTKLDPITTTTKSTEKVSDSPGLSTTTPINLDDCINIDEEPSDYDGDYGQQFIEARHGSSDRKRCPETGKITEPSSNIGISEGSTSSTTIKNNAKDPMEVVTQSSVSGKPVITNEEVDTEDSPEESTAVSDKSHSTTEKSKVDKLAQHGQTVVFPQSVDNFEVELISKPSIDEDIPKVIPVTTTETTPDSENQEIDQQIFVPVFPDIDTTTTKKNEHELHRTTIPPKKKIQPWVRASTQKPKISESNGSSKNTTSTTTQDPNSFKIHFPTESLEDIATTPNPKHVQIPKPPLVFKYARNFLNGSWTIIHSRFNGMTSFNRSWTEYRAPFGRIPGEYWAGLDAIHQLTKSGDYELLILLKSFDGSVKTAMYDSFWVGSEATNYRLALGPFVGGDAGDSFSGASGQMFSTYDRDNDRSLCASCGQIYHSGWWFKDCGDANLNGLYASAVEKEETSYGVSMNWWSFGRDYQGLQEAAMMVRKRGRKLF